MRPSRAEYLTIGPAPTRWAAAGRWLAVALLAAVPLLTPLPLSAADVASRGSVTQADESDAAALHLAWPPPPQRARIRYLGSISHPTDIGRQKGFWRRLWEFIRGDEEDERVVRPMATAVDSRDRLLVADISRGRVHVFDRRRGEYAFLQGSKSELLRLPIGLAVDGEDNVYVADGELKKIFVFTADGTFDHALDTAAWLERPSSLAIDRERHRLYVADVAAHDIKIINLSTGWLAGVVGHRGEGRGEFNFPTHIALDSRGRLAVTDSMNMRIQVFDTEGAVVSVFGKSGDGSGDFSAPKGVAIDGDGHIYVADAGFDNVQVFDEAGRLLLFWGNSGQEPGKFWLPTGVSIDARNRIYVADSYNGRVQIFQYLDDDDARSMK